MNNRRLHLLVAVAVLVTAVVAGVTQRASAAPGGCSPCVMLIQVDGLEPKDITPQTTPVLWAMGHSGSAAGTVGGGVTQIPGFSDRSGFMWQAPRGVMTAGVAPSTATLLTGGYAQQHGIPSDEYVGADGKRRAHAVTSAEGDSLELPINEPSVDMLPELIMASSEESGVAAIVGDPGLAPLVQASEGDQKIAPFWSPNDGSPEERGNPAYCSPPRDPSSPPASPPLCPASDTQTMDQAASLLTGEDGQRAAFSFIHLAGVGAVKRLRGDLDKFSPHDPEAQPPADQEAVQEALSELDQAIGQFVGRYSSDANGAQKWSNTIVFVVGSHGYELTPLPNRVPDPAAPADPGRDLARYVRDQAQAAGADDALLIPQGSFATIYYSGDASKKKDVLATLKQKLLDDAAGPNSTDVCRQAAPATPDGRCILDVNHVRVADAPENDKESALPAKHPSWNLDTLDPQSRKPLSGDLVVTLGRGWGAGDSVPVPSPDEVTAPPRWDNPYNGSGGGPRNRAVAMLVNGPETQVIGWSAAKHGGHYPVGDQAHDERQCKGFEPTPAYNEPRPVTAGGDPLPAADPNLAAANANPADDADDPGHECQAETVDVAPTIAALLKVGLPSEQIAGRFLQEAFQTKLTALQEEEDPGLPEPDPEPAPPPVPIEIPPPPPPPPPPAEFDFHGLVRNIDARVTDSKGCTWSQGRRGVKFSHLKIAGDFGKERAAVTLTFYSEVKGNAKKRRRATRAARWAARLGAAAETSCAKSKVSGASAGEPSTSTSVVSAAAGRVRLKTVVRFQPFTVQRGHVDLKLLVPDQFSPDHVGIVVQEAKKVKVRKSKKGRATPGFQGFGPKEGGVFAIDDAKRLHDVKGGKRRR